MAAGEGQAPTLQRQTLAPGQAQGHGNWDRNNKPVPVPASSPGAHFCLSWWVSCSRLVSLPLGPGTSTSSVLLQEARGAMQGLGEDPAGQRAGPKAPTGLGGGAQGGDWDGASSWAVLSSRNFLLVILLGLTRVPPPNSLPLASCWPQAGVPTQPLLWTPPAPSLKHSSSPGRSVPTGRAEREPCPPTEAGARLMKTPRGLKDHQGQGVSSRLGTVRAAGVDARLDPAGLSRRNCGGMQIPRPTGLVCAPCPRDSLHRLIQGAPAQPGDLGTWQAGSPVPLCPGDPLPSRMFSALPSTPTVASSSRPCREAASFQRLL